MFQLQYFTRYRFSMRLFAFHFFCTFFLMVMVSQALVLGLQKNLCISINEEPGKQIILSYAFDSKNKEDPFKASFYPVNPEQRYFASQDRRNQVKFKDTEMKICFETQKKGALSIDYYTHDLIHLADLASKSSVLNLHKKLIQTGESIKEIITEEKFEEERQMGHSQIIQDHESSLRSLAVFKIGVIIIVAVAQVYLLKRMLEKREQGYQAL